MKKADGITIIALTIIVIVMTIVIVASLKYVKQYMEQQRIEDIKSSMLAIQSVSTNIKNKNTVDKENNSLVGTKLDLENNETEYQITEKLKNELSTEGSTELYILNKEELNNLGVKNVEINNTEFYIVDYNSEEIYYSLGINGKYKLSDM